MATRHQRAAYDRARVVPDDSFLMTGLEQGPGLMPRHQLADTLRGYGLNTLADRANSPGSGLGLLADAVGGAADMLIGQPYRSMTNLLSRPYVCNLRPGDI